MFSGGGRRAVDAGRTPGRWRRLPAALTALVIATVCLIVIPARAQGPDPVHCRPNDPRVSVPGNFALDACFDGSTLLILNRTTLPAFVHLSGDLRFSHTSRFAGTSSWASTAFAPLGNMLLVPDYQMFVDVGSGSGAVDLSFDADVARQYMEAKIITGTLPSWTGLPEVFAAWLPEVDAAYVDLVRCLGTASGFFAEARCSLGFTWDMVYADARVVVEGVLTVTEIKQVVKALTVEAASQAGHGGSDVNAVAGDLAALRAAALHLNVPAAAKPPGAGSGGDAGGTGSGSGGGERNGGSTTGGTSLPSGPLQFSVHGSCTSDGGTLGSSSANFTPGGSANIRAWYPDGREYTDLVHTSAVRGDGSIHWSWPCAGDPPGTYTTEVVDTSTGRSTGRVPFSIGAPPEPPPPPPSTVTEQSGSHGSPTFQNVTNASGQGPTVPAYGYVQVSCKIKPTATIDSAYPDGYWYRIASPPWNNGYYAVANTFWNGDMPGQKPYTHNTDWNVPDC